MTTIVSIIAFLLFLMALHLGFLTIIIRITKEKIRRAPGYLDNFYNHYVPMVQPKYPREFWPTVTRFPRITPRNDIMMVMVTGETINEVFFASTFNEGSIKPKPQVSERAREGISPE